MFIVFISLWNYMSVETMMHVAMFITGARIPVGMELTTPIHFNYVKIETERCWYALIPYHCMV